MESVEKLLEIGNIPKHVAIIMDGNGRWAKERGLSRIEGHREGINSVREIVEVAAELKLEALTLYTFSSENWNRPKLEVSALMTLLLKTVRKEVKELHKNNIRVKTIGQLSDLPSGARRGMEEAILKTKNNTGMQLNLALSYSSRTEIILAAQKLARQCVEGELEPEQIDDNLFSQSLYTSGLPDPDLLIRTSGESRISNFLLWQLAYTEILITETRWPDFRKNDFIKAIEDYTNRERRFGRVSEQLS